MKKKDLMLGVLVSLLLVGPIVAGPILFTYDHVVAGILVFVIPYSALALMLILLKVKKNKVVNTFPEAHKNFNIIPLTDPEILCDLYMNSALTFLGGTTEKGLDILYNWLGSERVLKGSRVNLYTYDGKLMKEAFGKDRRFGDEEKFMSIFLKDLNLNDSNMRQFAIDRFSIGGRWLDDIVDNSAPEK